MQNAIRDITDGTALNMVCSKAATHEPGNTLISAAYWGPEKDGLKAAHSNREVWGGWIWVGEDGGICWFDASFTPSAIFAHEFTAGKSGKII